MKVLVVLEDLKSFLTLSRMTEFLNEKIVWPWLCRMENELEQFLCHKIL